LLTFNQYLNFYDREEDPLGNLDLQNLDKNRILEALDLQKSFSPIRSFSTFPFHEDEDYPKRLTILRQLLGKNRKEKIETSPKKSIFSKSISDKRNKSTVLPSKSSTTAEVELKDKESVTSLPPIEEKNTPSSETIPDASKTSNNVLMSSICSDSIEKFEDSKEPTN